MYEVVFSAVDRHYTVGYHDGSGRWHAIKDVADEDEAVSTISVLNGGTGLNTTELRLWLEGFDNSIARLAVCVSSIMLHVANAAIHLGVPNVLMDYNLTVKGETDETHRERTERRESRTRSESPPDLPELRRPSSPTDA